MKRFFKIFGITVGSLLGLVIIVAVVAVWLVFTPARLTPIARQAVDKFITCEHQIGEVDLTFFSTFPEFGLRADGLYLINPMTGAQSDTLLAAPKVRATVNVVEFLKNRNLNIREVSLENAVANLYINNEGQSNLDVFVTSPDTTEDTTAFSLPFEQIEVRALSLTSPCLTFVDEQDSIKASLLTTDLAARVGSWDDVLLNLESQAVSAQIGDTRYADSLQVQLHIPASVDLEAMHFDLKDAHVSINEFDLALTGTVDMQDALRADVALQTNTWQVEPLLALLPESLRNSLAWLHLNGALSLDAEARLDMATKQSHATIHALKADVWHSQLAAMGEVDDLLNDMFLDVDIDLDKVPLSDIAFLLPQSMLAKGVAQGKVHAAIGLDDLTAMNLDKGHFTGQLQLKQLDFQMDSMSVLLTKPTLMFTLPNPAPSHKRVDWVQAHLEFDELTFTQPGMRVANTYGVLDAESGNVLSDDPVLYAAARLQSANTLLVEMDSLSALVENPDLTAYAEYDTKDTTHIPVLQANLTFDDLSGNYTDIVGHLRQSTLKARISGGRRDKTIPHLAASIHTVGLDAEVGSGMKVQTASLALDAAARYNSKGDNILLQWNPLLRVDLTQGEADLEQLEKMVTIPQMKFQYSNRAFTIDTSRIELGNSDFSLSGKIYNIGKWLQHRDTLVGELNFISDYTDANELLALFSADKGEEEVTEEPVAESTESDTAAHNPFLVPTDVNLSLNTHIKQTAIFNQVANNLGGRIYVQDGKLVLDQVGLICRAAKLQLTAMYRSPYRDHLYLGLDYHMLDVDLQELISMIPDLGTMVPMLNSFRGGAEFHLAAETYLTEEYKPKTSTIRGACSIEGKDLVVLDSETFTKISKLLMFNKKTENRIDSLSAEMTIYKNEIDVYPFTVSIDHYMAALGGRHNLDMTFDYHVNLLKPLYIGVDVSGTFDDLNIKLAPCRYAQDFRPLFHGKVNTQSAELREIIRNSLHKNVRIQSENQ